ncbi:hypothetical protein [Pseudomonas qingdaonensis]|uniref:hypothetical protein n=1 Tax=Pseudomonas qingdaonensis TaxID=2056231 RepID=UPI002431D8D4|nr:hypothetical protein [Pseudomonas qingdaonensis]
MNELGTLHQAISAALSAGMPQLRHVEAFARPDENTALPALMHTLTGMRPGVDPGDGRTCVNASFEARILVSKARQQASLEAMTLAAQLTALLRQQFWSLGFVDAISQVQARPSAIPAEVPGTLEWRVQWQQPVYLGDLQWPWPDQPPGSLLFAFSPDTGPAHKDSYQAPEDMA